MSYTKASKIYVQKRISILAGLTLSSLACKCVFYRPKHNAREDSMQLNFEGLQMQKWNIPTDRAQRAYEKNGIICLVMVFTSRLMVIKMIKNSSFSLFYADGSKKSVKVWTKYLSVSKRSYLALLENIMDYLVLSYH